MKKLICHIGYPKCASTRIQGFIASNVDNFLRSGISVISGNGYGPGEGLWHGYSSPFIANLSNKTNNDFIENVNKSISNGETDYFLISAENLSEACNFELAVKLSKICDISCIMYIRPQWQWLLSAWTQWGVKEGLCFDDYVMSSISRKEPRFLDTANNWSEISNNNITVRPLNKNLLNQGNIVADFCKNLDIKFESFRDINDKKDNPGINYAIASIAAKNSNIYSGMHDTSLDSFLSNQSENKIDNSTDLVAEPLVFRLIEKIYESENRTLCEKFICDDYNDANQIYDKIFLYDVDSCRPHMDKYKKLEIVNQNLFRMIVEIYQNISR